MRVPYRLIRRSITEPATALFLPGHDTGELLRLLAALALDTWPPIHLLADGFLVKQPNALTVVPPGVVRLCGPVPDLLMPADADLVPPLLSDEAEALVRRRGLIFLPGERVLGFAPDRPLPPPALLQVDGIIRRPWQSLPEPDELADALTEVELELPSTSPDEMLAAGGSDIGTEAPELEDRSLPSRAAGNALYGFGQGLAWLGQKLNLPGLAGAGGRMIDAAMSMAPGLSEKLMGKQEALLRRLLKEFRAGNIDKALRRALPLDGEPGRAAQPAADARLPTHSLLYSLLNLLGGAPRGPGSLWYSSDDTYVALRLEYRKQAEEALRRGDCRRAAFIYARLLNDYRNAALALASGGLHRDAALLFERKVADQRAAARAWEAAGEVERAVRLYRQLREHALAGDLLRRAGDEEHAVDEYRLAADMLVTGASRYYEAAELLRSRALRPDLARPLYDKGWAARPAGTPITCALRLAEDHAMAGNAPGLRALLDEADEYLEIQGADLAGSFYNAIAHLASAPSLAAMREELRDRALGGLAKKLRQGAPNLTGKFFGGGNWPAPLLRDAEFAARQPRPAPRTTCRTLPIDSGTVTAVCQFPRVGHMFIGFENGDIVSYRPSVGDVVVVARAQGTILGLAPTSGEATLMVLSQDGPTMRLTALSCASRFDPIAQATINGPSPGWLGFSVGDGLDDLAVVGTGHAILLYRVPQLICLASFQSPFQDAAPAFACLVRPFENRSYLLILDEAGEARIWREGDAASQMSWTLADTMTLWAAGRPGATALSRPCAHAAFDGNSVRLTGLDDRGRVYQASPTWRASHGELVVGFAGDHYHACAELGGECLAAVRADGVDWCRRGKVQRTAVILPSPVAAFPVLGGAEVVVVSADGTLSFLISPW